MGRKIAEAEEIRHASDYDDFYIATREEVEEQIDTAVELVAKNRRIRLERDGIIVFVSFMKYLWRFFKNRPGGAGQAVTCSTSGMGLRLK